MNSKAFKTRLNKNFIQAEDSKWMETQALGFQTSVVENNQFEIVVP